MKFKLPEQLDDAVDWAFENYNPKGLSKLDIFLDIQNILLTRIENGQDTDYIIFTK